MTTSELLTPGTISELAGQLWCSVVPAEPPLEEHLRASHLLGDGPSLTGRVNITGSWEGAVELSCSLPAARKMAAAMFCLPEAELDDPAVRDAVGELVNIVGGNLKSLLPPPTTLSLPLVGSTRCEPEGRHAVCEAGFTWLAEPVVVRVCRGDDCLPSPANDVAES